jgi:Ca2+/Na+ antiporter
VISTNLLHMLRTNDITITMSPKNAVHRDTIFFDIAVFISGLFLLEFGADKFVDHTAIVARRLGVSQTLVALLTAGAEWEEVRRRDTIQTTGITY